jgi:hypothetical protein
MADYTYNVTVNHKNLTNLYHENRSSVTGLNPLFISGGPTNLGNYYIYQGNSGALSGLFNINDFKRSNIFATADILYVWTGNNPSNFIDAIQFYPRSTSDEWRILGQTTNYNSFPILNNYIMGIKLYSGYVRTLIPNNGINFENYSCFYINNIQASGLYFEKGKSYRFIQTGISNSGNPLNIYLDEYGNKKLEKYVSISGTAGVDRYITVSIPKSFKETNTIYYGNESGEFFGAPIKLISTDYYLKHNIKLICLDVKHDGKKYIIPDNLLDQKFINYYNNENYFALTSGIFGFISTPDGTNISSSSLMTRKDTLSVNLVQSSAGLINSNFNINYFGNILTYKTNATGSNEWSNLSDLYWLIHDKSFNDSGRMDDFTATDKEYNQYGYLLSGCEGGVNKITLATGEGNVYSGTFEIYYNPINLINDITANSFLNTTTGNMQTEDFITFDNIGAVIYSKSFYSDANYSIPRKV